MGFFDSLLRSAITPGVPTSLVTTVNVVLALFFLSLVVSVASGVADVHTLVMGTLGLGLLVSMNYHVARLRQNERAAAQEAAASEGAPAAAPVAALAEGDSSKQD
jgi:ER protein Pkr1